jgi:hypothetical protein
MCLIGSCLEISTALARSQLIEYFSVKGRADSAGRQALVSGGSEKSNAEISWPAAVCLRWPREIFFCFAGFPLAISQEALQSPAGNHADGKEQEYQQSLRYLQIPEQEPDFDGGDILNDEQHHEPGQNETDD